MKRKQDRHYKEVFGWTEQNECSWGITKRNVDLIPSEDGVSVYEDGRLFGPEFDEGDWFISFTAAKKAVMQLWRERLQVAKEAIKSIRKQNLMS